MPHSTSVRSWEQVSESLLWRKQPDEILDPLGYVESKQLSFSSGTQDTASKQKVNVELKSKVCNYAYLKIHLLS